MNLSECLSRIEPQSAKWREAARDHIRSLTMPRWALGRLLDLAVDLAGITRRIDFPVARKKIVLMAGDHGVVAEKVSPQPQCVTVQMLRNFSRGGGAIRVLAANAGADVRLVDLGVNADVRGLPGVIHRKIAFGTENMRRGPAMSRAQALASLEAGIALAEELAPETDVFATGEMGIGNTTPSSAILTVLSGESDPTPFVGSGAGLDAGRLAHKSQVIREAIELNKPNPSDALDILAKVGGFEIGGIAGLILGAAACRRPVLVDGFISTAGALLAQSLAPVSAEYMIPAHASSEPGHRRMMQLLGKEPLLDLGLRLGEGTGAALAMPLLDAARAVMTQMSTFSSAGVTEEGL